MSTTSTKSTILTSIQGFLGGLAASATTASLNTVTNTIKGWIKKYWWVLLPLPIMVIYWVYNYFKKTSKKGKR